MLSSEEDECGLVREGISRRCTMIILLGLHQLEASSAASPIETKPVLDNLLANTNWVDNISWVYWL